VCGALVAMLSSSNFFAWYRSDPVTHRARSDSRIGDRAQIRFRPPVSCFWVMFFLLGISARVPVCAPAQSHFGAGLRLDLFLWFPRVGARSRSGFGATARPPVGVLFSARDFTASCCVSRHAVLISFAGALARFRFSFSRSCTLKRCCYCRSWFWLKVFSVFVQLPMCSAQFSIICSSHHRIFSCSCTAQDSLVSPIESISWARVCVLDFAAVPWFSYRLIEFSVAARFQFVDPSDLSSWWFLGVARGLKLWFFRFVESFQLKVGIVFESPDQRLWIFLVLHNAFVMVSLSRPQCVRLNMCEIVRRMLIRFWSWLLPLWLLLAPSSVFVVTPDWLTRFWWSIVFYSYVILAELGEGRVGSNLKHRPSSHRGFWLALIHHASSRIFWSFKRCCQACGFQGQGFWLLKKLNSQLSFEPESCYLGDHTRGARDPSDAWQHDLS
jgi:hypothetical protein